MREVSSDTGFWAAVADADTAFVVTDVVAAALAAVSAGVATTAGRRLEPTADRTATVLDAITLVRCICTAVFNAAFRADADGATFAAVTRDVEALACPELDADADGADEPVELSAAAAPHPAVIDAPIPIASTAPPIQPE